MKKRIAILLALLVAAALLAGGCDVLTRVLSDENVQQALVQALTEQSAAGESAAPEQKPAAKPQQTAAPDDPQADGEDAPDEDGAYTSRDDVALYLYTYERLPENFITKSEARALGWSGGSLEAVAPGMSIGGDTFGNREGLLPEKSGRKYYECDIDTLGKSSRGAKRIVYSSDGLIYYTDDHYGSFTLLYGEE